MNGFDIFLKDLANDPMKVFDAYKKFYSSNPMPPDVVGGVPGGGMPTILTDDAPVLPTGVYGGPADNEAERRKKLKELENQPGI